MPADNTYDVAHQANKIDHGYRSGCFSRNGLEFGYWAPDRVYLADGSYRETHVFIVNEMSRKCRQIGVKHGPNWSDLPGCQGCTTLKDEEYIANARAAIELEMASFFKTEQRTS